ncbi:MAG TPA: 16S rRNA (cytosine(967)-C(5))-methyltransferase RsmB [Sporosarcina sp.]|nr:16S rRNA (cytosine(967)-C(5))-methyltransferase RsmB [Sporosarcina sp.]
MSKQQKKIWTGNVRDAALSMLIDIEKNQAYSNLLLHKTIGKYAIHDKDRSLLTELTYGPLQYKMTLDYYLEPFVRGKLDHWVRQLLRMSLYQIVYLTKIPPHAVVHEAVEIAKRRGHKRIAPTVNGILRSVLREGVRSVEEIADPIERLAIETSHPTWLIKRWVAQYGETVTRDIAHANNRQPNFSFRVNETRTTVEKVVAALEDEGIKTRPGEIIAECLISESGNPANTSVYREGLMTIQDESSMLPVQALQLSEGLKVLDMCAAPGGKTTHIAEKMNDQGEVYAHDVHDHKVKLIEKNAKRLHLSSIQTKSGDSRKLVDVYGEAQFDRILLDAPCSGFGVIRRKPEIKYTKTAADVEQLSTIQFDLLTTAAQLLKENGILVYSTCTIDEKENQEMVQRFLAAQPNMALAPLGTLQSNESLHIENDVLQVLPQQFNGDGFFVAAFKKHVK